MKQTFYTPSLMLVLLMLGCGDSEDTCSCTEPGLKVTVPAGQVSTILAGDIACQGASIECLVPGVSVGPECTSYRVLPATSGACNVIVEF